MKCKCCQLVVDEKYKVNQLGDVFCDDDCYDKYIDENVDSPDDFNHPYIDDYELIRSNYIDWLENWESDLESIVGGKVLLKANEMIDTIDEVFNEYSDYYISEGDDGVFAREIYLYLLKFEELQKNITQWKPKREVFFNMERIVKECR